MNEPLVWATGLFLAAVRPGAALLAAPFFAHIAVPPQLRVGLALAIAMIAGPAPVPADIAGMALTVLGEVVTGLAIGFVAQAAYGAATVAGELIGSTLGLGFATMADGQHGALPLPSTLLGFSATALMIAANLHLALIGTVAASYTRLPVGGGFALPDLAGFGALLFGGAIAIALPALAAIVATQLIVALIARAAPALNLFAVGLPAVQLAGLAALAFAFPAMGDAMGEVLLRAFALKVG